MRDAGIGVVELRFESRTDDDDDDIPGVEIIFPSSSSFLPLSLPEESNRLGLPLLEKTPPPIPE